MLLLRVIDAILVPAMGIGGIVSGFYLPLRLFGHRRGFKHGVALGALFTALFSILGATLFGGWGEEILGTTWGVPIGLAVGGLCTAFVMTSISGLMGCVSYAA